MDATFPKVGTVHRRLSGIFIIQAHPTRPSSNTITPSESGACTQRLRGVYANVGSANVVCTATKKEAVVFTILPSRPVRGKPFVKPDASPLRLYISCSVNLQQSDVLDIQRAETVQDETSITQRRPNMKVTAVVSQKPLTGSVSASLPIAPNVPS